MRILAPLLIAGLLLVGAAPVGAATKSELSAKALSISNFPTGWSADNSNAQSSDQGCLSALKTAPHETKVAVRFQYGNLPEVDEVLATGRGAPAAYRALGKALSRCTTYRISSGGTTASVSVGAMSFPPVGQQSAAYALKITVQGVNAGADLVVFRVGSIFGAVDYSDIGTPDAGQALAYVTEAVDKLEGKPTTTPTTY